MKIGEAGLFKTILTILFTINCVFTQEGPDNSHETDSNGKTLDYYESILEKHSNMIEAQFGIGVGSYLMSDFDRAESEFQAVIQAENQNLIGKAFYNLGNTLYQQGLFEESVEAFKKSLEIVPEDYDAKYNYELSKRMLQQQMNQNSQKRQSSEDEKKEESNEEQQSSQSDDKDQPQQKDSEDQNNTQTSNEQETEEAQSERKEEDQPKPDAETILNALKANEKNLMKRQLDRAMKSKKLEKDW